MTTTLELPAELRARINRLAEASGCSPHGLMVRAIEREERLQTFVQVALEADRDIEAGGEIYGPDDAHAWLERLASGAHARLSDLRGCGEPG